MFCLVDVAVGARADSGQELEVLLRVSTGDIAQSTSRRHFAKFNSLCVKWKYLKNTNCQFYAVIQIQMSDLVNIKLTQTDWDSLLEFLSFEQDIFGIYSGQVYRFFPVEIGLLRLIIKISIEKNSFLL